MKDAIYRKALDSDGFHQNELGLSRLLRVVEISDLANGPRPGIRAQRPLHLLDDSELLPLMRLDFVLHLHVLKNSTAEAEGQLLGGKVGVVQYDDFDYLLFGHLV